MRTYTYRAAIEPGAASGVFVASFPDVPEAITEGDGQAGALREAEDALGVALLSYPMRGLPLPRPSARQGDAVTVAPEVAAKLAVLEAFAASGISNAKTTARKSRVTRRTMSASSNCVTSIATMPAKRTPSVVSPKIAAPKRMNQAIIGGWSRNDSAFSFDQVQ